MGPPASPLVVGKLAPVEPAALRSRLLHVAARITRTARRWHPHLDRDWPWATQLAVAFHPGRAPGRQVPTSIRSSGVGVVHGSASDLGSILDTWPASPAERIACVIGDLRSGRRPASGR